MIDARAIILQAILGLIRDLSTRTAFRKPSWTRLAENMGWGNGTSRIGTSGERGERFGPRRAAQGALTVPGPERPPSTLRPFLSDRSGNGGRRSRPCFLLMGDQQGKPLVLLVRFRQPLAQIVALAL